MRTTSISALLALVLLAPAAAPARNKKKEDRPKGVEVVKEGKIRVVRGLSGGEPQLTDAKGTRHLCVGPDRDELLRLDGHTVRAWGTLGGDRKLMMPTFKVIRYEITDSGGHKPMVGQLRKEAKETYVLERKEGNLTVQANKGLMRQLAQRAGCKVWMVGEVEGTTLRPYKFGWIRCAPPKAIKPSRETSKGTGKETRR